METHLTQRLSTDGMGGESAVGSTVSLSRREEEEEVDEEEEEETEEEEEEEEEEETEGSQGTQRITQLHVRRIKTWAG